MTTRSWAGTASHFDVPPNGYAPLSLGSTIVGWTSPPWEEGIREARTAKAVMGNKAYVFEIPALWLAREPLGLTGDEDFEFQSGFLSDIILNVPVGSLDVTTHSHFIKYTERTAKTLHSALSNFFRLREAHIQSELHKLTTPSQAMEALLTLMTNHYSWNSLIELSWRGEKLKNLPSASNMTYQNQIVRWGTSLQTVLPVRLAETSSFMGFLGLQTLNEKVEKAPGDRVFSDFKPENVFLLKAESEEEQSLGEKLFVKEYLDVFLYETNHQTDLESNRTFFFAQADDSLANWVIGTTITVSELHKLLRAKGVV